jgi:peptidoglycan hydrolase CwlO-like protein
MSETSGNAKSLFARYATLKNQIRALESQGIPPDQILYTRLAALKTALTQLGYDADNPPEDVVTPSGGGQFMQGGQPLDLNQPITTPSQSALLMHSGFKGQAHGIGKFSQIDIPRSTTGVGSSHGHKLVGSQQTNISHYESPLSSLMHGLFGVNRSKPAAVLPHHITSGGEVYGSHTHTAFKDSSVAANKKTNTGSTILSGHTNAEFNELQTRFDASQQQNEQLQVVVDNDKKKINDLQNQLSATKGQLAESIRKQKKAQSDLDTETRNVASLKSQLKRAVSTMAITSGERDEAKAQVETLKSQLKTSQANLAKAKSDLVEAAGTITALKSQMKVLLARARN